MRRSLQTTKSFKRQVWQEVATVQNSDDLNLELMQAGSTCRDASTGLGCVHQGLITLSRAVCTLLLFLKVRMTLSSPVLVFRCSSGSPRRRCLGPMTSPMAASATPSSSRGTSGSRPPIGMGLRSLQRRHRLLRRGRRRLSSVLHKTPLPAVGIGCYRLYSLQYIYCT